MRAFWPFTFNLIIFSSFAFMVPFFVLYFQSVGLTGTQIGLLTGITPLVTLVAAPLWTGLADATRRHGLLLSLALLGVALAVFAHPWLTSFVALMVAAVLLNAFFAPVPAFADSATLF